MIAVLILGFAAILSAPLIILSKRRYRGPRVLRYDVTRGRWVATYRRLR